MMPILNELENYSSPSDDYLNVLVRWDAIEILKSLAVWWLINIESFKKIESIDQSCLNFWIDFDRSI